MLPISTKGFCFHDKRWPPCLFAKQFASNGREEARRWKTDKAMAGNRKSEQAVSAAMEQE